MSARRLFLVCAMVVAMFASGVQLVPAAGAATAPANDAYANRITISPDETVSFVNLGATFEPAVDLPAVQAACGTTSFPDGFQVPSIWYDVTPTASGRMMVLFPESDFNAVAVVVTGDPGSFVGAACAFSTFDAVAGTTYHVAVADLGGGPGGSGQFVVATAPPPPTVAVTVDRVGTIERSTDSVVLGGSVTCTGADALSLTGQVRQVVGRYFINAFLSADLGACDGTTHRWTGTASGASGRFRRGTAQLLSGDVQACNTFECTDVAIPVKYLRLKSVRGEDPTPPPPPSGSFSIAVDPTGTVDRTTNVATLGGTVTCTGGGDAFLSGILRQVEHRIFIDGFALADLGVCDGAAHRWNVDVLAQTGLFGSGRATIPDGFAGVCDEEFNCTGVAVNAKIKLQATGKRPPFGAPPAGPGSPGLLVDVDSSASLDRATNTATIEGTVTCTEGDFGLIAITVRQLAHRIYIDGQGFIETLVCDGIPHRWSAPVEGQTGRFSRGHAVVFGDASACGATDCVSSPISADVRLRTDKHRHGHR